MKRLVVLVVLGLLVTGVVAAVRILPWWVLGLGLLGAVVLGKFLAGRLIRKVFLLPFRAKGAVLKGASIQVHRILPAVPPASDQGSGNPSYLVDVTITPQEGAGPFGMWEPGELRLVRPESVLQPESDEPDDDDACTITKLQIEDNGDWTDDEGMKYPGAQRLRLSVTTQTGIRTLKFRYYFEEFGQILLPRKQEKVAV